MDIFAVFWIIRSDPRRSEYNRHDAFVLARSVEEGRSHLFGSLDDSLIVGAKGYIRCKVLYSLYTYRLVSDKLQSHLIEKLTL